MFVDVGSNPVNTVFLLLSFFSRVCSSQLVFNVHVSCICIETFFSSFSVL